jgi:hypothetical protein
MKNLTDNDGVKDAILDFLEKWEPDKVNDILWDLLLEMLASPSSGAFDLHEVALFIRDFQKLSIKLNKLKNLNNLSEQKPSKN